MKVLLAEEVSKVNMLFPNGQKIVKKRVQCTRFAKTFSQQSLGDQDSMNHTDDPKDQSIVPLEGAALGPEVEMAKGADAKGLESGSNLEATAQATDAQGLELATEKEATGPLVPAIRPTEATERLLVLDLLRGFALLGILLMNIVHFSWPEGAYSNPTYLYYTPDSIGNVPKDEEKPKDKKPWGAHGVYPHGELKSAAVSGYWDQGEWVFAALFFENKMRTLFSMLFGAGVVLMNRHSHAKKGSPFWLHFRRMCWLLVFGAIHAYFLWVGDILFGYAAIGFLLYPFLRLSAGWLLGVGAFFFLLPLGIYATVPGLADWVKERGAEVAQKAKVETMVGEKNESTDAKPPQGSESFQAAMDGLFLKGFEALEKSRLERQQPEKVTRAIREVNRKGYAEWFLDRWSNIFWMHVGLLLLGFLLMGWPMLLGMGLMKLGFFEGAWSVRSYKIVAMVGYGLGIPMDWCALVVYLGPLKDLKDQMQVILPLNCVAMLLITLANASALVWLYKIKRIEWIAKNLQAVGRMALSNYLLDTLICTTLFSGAMGLYGVVPRMGLLGIVLLIWTIHLILSPIWLRYFAFGPMEWLWRSLTYWKMQPLLAKPN